MARNLNRCEFIGRLGKDPDVRYTPNGDAVVNFNIAVGESWKDDQGEKQERTEWVRIVAWNKLAEICGEYLKKGAKIYIAGKLRTRKWEDQNGQDKYTTEILAKEMEMLDTRSTGVNSQSGTQSHDAPIEGEVMPPVNEFEDEIPFDRLRHEYLI